MKRFYEFRIFEEYASSLLKDNEGEKLGLVRKVIVDINDPLFESIGDLNKELKAKNKFLFSFFKPIYRYSKLELENAKIFKLNITGVFDPTGVECGTVYDESMICPICKSGRKQISDLILDLRKVPKNKNIAKTLADNENIIDQKLANILIEKKLKGFELRPVKHKAYCKEEAIDLTKLKKGNELLKKAKDAGIDQHSWRFYVWLNQPAQASLYQKMVDEYVLLKNNTSQKEMLSLPKWYQLVVKSKPVKIASTTRFGIDPFDEDKEGKYRCPNGHISGFKILSELSVEKDSWDGSDINLTESMVGCRQGVYVPAPLITISKRLYNLLKDYKIKGFETEVAYLL
jgi:hypothetical protein